MKTPFDGFLLSFLMVTMFLSFLKATFVPVDMIVTSDVGILRGPHLRFLSQSLNLALMVSVYFSTLMILKDRKIVIRSINTLFFSTFLVSLYGLYQFIGNFFSWPFTYISQVRPESQMPFVQGLAGIRRINSTFAEPKHLAFFLIPVMLSLFYLLIKKQNQWGKKPKFYCFLSLFIFVFLLTFSRSAWILLGLSLVILLPFLLSQIKLLQLLKISLLMCVCLLFIFSSIHWLTGLSLGPALEYRLTHISYDIWGATIDYPEMRAALDGFLKHPLFGIGYGNFPFFLAGSKWCIDPGIHISPNQFLMLLVETGILGFFLFICFVLGSLTYCLRMIKKIRNQFWHDVSIALLFAVVGTFLTLLYDSQLNQPFFWFFIGMLKACINLHRKEKKLDYSLL